MSQSMRDALQDGIALLGTALASIGSAGYLPDSATMVAAGGGGLDGFGACDPEGSVW